ncbi:MAG: FHA domain-containing protein [Aggregatilineales bacterium]
MSDDETKKPTLSTSRDTSFLNTPKANPMLDRPPRPQTSVLGPDWGLEFKIGDKTVLLEMKTVIIVGRSAEGDSAKPPSFDLTPHGAYQHGVSRQHAAITHHNGSLYIEDLGSTNGTRINGFQLTARRKYRLRDGDEVEFARIRTLVRFVRPSSSINTQS